MKIPNMKTEGRNVLKAVVCLLLGAKKSREVGERRSFTGSDEPLAELRPFLRCSSRNEWTSLAHRMVCNSMRRKWSWRGTSSNPFCRVWNSIQRRIHAVVDDKTGPN